MSKDEDDAEIDEDSLLGRLLARLGFAVFVVIAGSTASLVAYWNIITSTHRRHHDGPEMLPWMFGATAVAAILAFFLYNPGGASDEEE